MGGIYCGGVYGGSRSAVLLNISGASAAVATGFDGYPLAKLGEAGQAIGLSTTASVIGGYLGILALATCAPVISEFSLMFAPRDYFLLAIMGLLLVGSLSGESLAKGIFSGALGVFLSMVGMDTFTGMGRFTFGSVGLMSGIHFVAIMIGLFGVSEALVQIHDIHLKPIKQNVARIIPSWRLLFKNTSLIIRSALIGIWIGALPGAGGDIAALMAYGHARRSVKNPSRPFGQGAYEGVIAPETANNAAIGGDNIPMLTLGIPGDAVTAVIIGALTFRPEARPDADGGYAASVLVLGRRPHSGQHVSPAPGLERDQGVCEARRGSEGTTSAAHHRHLGRGHVRDQQ
jgi:putative tricarboxylic transport membrane protein